MSSESKISWNFLKNVSDVLNSYRIRALLDAKKDVLESGIYNESEFYDILFKMFDEERLKYAFFDFLKSKKSHGFDSLEQFANDNSIEITKAYSLLELLRNENLVHIQELIDVIEDGDDKPPKRNFKGLSFYISNSDLSKIRSVYEPVKVIFDSKICSGCGLCAGICPVNCIEINNGFGKIDDDKCIRCGLCYFICPRSFLPTRVLRMTQDSISEIKDYGNFGPFIKAFCARTKVKEIAEECQDGGISSTCLYHLLDSKRIDFALGATMSKDPWRPEPILIEGKEDIIKSAGTKYVNNPNLMLLNDERVHGKNLAVVGVPCQMQALLKSQIYNIGFPSLNKIKYRIGIFCMESFPYAEGFLKICEKLNVNVIDVKKTDINKGKFFIYTKSGEELNIPIKEISDLARIDCEFCHDLTSESADISVGSIGAPVGWNTVIIRTEKGKELYDELIEHDLIESKDINDVKPGLPLLSKIAGNKRKKCENHVNSKINSNQRFPRY
ncbi:MAG: Coenzyme F420 hydrogenase/dehydrogenase, beta subunit C-terminal domain [Promethearchaeota archaeon]